MKSLNLIVMNPNPQPFNYDLTTFTDLIPISAGSFLSNFLFSLATLVLRTLKGQEYFKFLIDITAVTKNDAAFCDISSRIDSLKQSDL